ncbi:hypothetical protein, partial [Janthinobacterium sp. JC611]|uniref:hypothetical protein n=1 Tax=Janthinobacterium sp. JC611 TaxID=2816201 RepID=UPI001BFE3F2E
LASNAHTYRLLIVKERYSVLFIYCSRAIDKALCLSAAKKEEYEAFRQIRQHLLYYSSPFPVILKCRSDCVSLGRRTIAKSRPGSKLYPKKSARAA